MNRAYVLVLSILFLTMTGGEAAAHKVSIYGYAEGGKVYTESYFAGGGRCAECAVQVRERASGQEVLSGVTDSKGRFDFNYEGGASLELTVDAGGGHMGTFLLDVAGASGDTDAMPEATGPSLNGDRSGPAPPGLEAAIEKKLEPIRRELISLREAVERPGLAEVLGGIGYIIGLLGLWAYLKNREKK